MQINQILLKARKMAASQKLKKLSQNIIETALGKANTELLPNENFTLVGQSELEKFFNEKIIDVLRYPERYARFGITAPGSILLHGKPGVGKTYAIKQLANYLKMEVFKIKMSELGSVYIHEIAVNISKVFTTQ